MMATWRLILLQAGLATAYALAGGLGLLLAFAHPSVSPVWAPTGIALTAGLLLGARAWPAVFVGAFVVNVTTDGSVPVSLGIAFGNTLEAALGTHLVSRFARGSAAFRRARSAFRFVLLAAGLSPMVAATVGVASLWLGGHLPPGDWSNIWITWWLGDAVGALTVTPLVLTWIAQPRIEWDLRRAAEAAVLGSALIATAMVVFTGASPLTESRSPIEFVIMPLLMWAAYRFGPREAISAVVTLSAIAIAGTVNGHGPFVVRTPNDSLLLLQSFIGVAAATTLVIAAAIAQRRRAEQTLREWSTTDPLTGLANYRQLTTVLEREIQRSQRTGRSFALLLLDLDHLKQINDRDGHLVGSRALCRVADILQGECRSVDSAARYGGDEFAVVLPETDETDARRLADRVAAQLARDGEWPPLSVSIGVAVSPEDGDAVETLIDAADQRMYGAKRGRRSAEVELPAVQPG